MKKMIVPDGTSNVEKLISKKMGSRIASLQSIRELYDDLNITDDTRFWTLSSWQWHGRALKRENLKWYSIELLV